MTTLKKNKLSVFFLIKFFLLIQISSTHAASRYWIATTTSNWNNTANWSTSSGGSGGASVPGASDIANFNSNRNGNVTLDANVNVEGFYISGYTGVITNTNHTITIGVSWLIQSSGTFNGGSGNINIGSRLTISGGSFNAGSGTLDIDGTGFYLSGGTFTSTSGDFKLSSNWEHTTSGTFNHNNGTVIFDGSTDIYSCKISIIGNTETFYNLTFDLTSGNRLMNSNNDNLVVLNNLNLTRGIIAPWNDGYAVAIDIRGNATVSSTFGYVHKDVTLLFSGTTSVQNFDLTGATALVDGHIKINKSSGEVKLLSDLTMNGGAAQNFTFTSGTFNLNGKTVNNTSGGFVYINGSTSNLSGTGNFNHSNLNQSAGTFNVTGASLINIYSGFTIAGGTFNSNSVTLDIDGSFNLSTGTFNAPSGNMYVSYAWDHPSSGTFNHNFGTVTFDGTHGSWYIMDFVTQEVFYNVNYNKSSCTYNKMATGADIMVVEGNLNLISGQIWSRSWESGGVGAKNLIKVRGNVTISSTYCDGSYPPTITFICGDNQNLDLTGATSNYDGDIIINKSSGKVTLLSNLTLNRTGGQQLIVGNGTLDLNGYTISIGSSSGVTKYNGGTITYNGGSVTGGSVTNNGSNYSVDPYTCGVLPVKLLYLKIENLGNKALLKWATVSEINNDYFIIEKSYDNKSFENIGSVKGNGTTNQLVNYSFIDNTFNGEESYYRLKQIDFDGKHEYSHSVVLRMESDKNKNIFKIYPNPASNLITIESFGLKAPETKFVISDIHGKIFMHDSFHSISSLDVLGLVNGLYFISFYNLNNELEFKQKLFIAH